MYVHMCTYIFTRTYIFICIYRHTPTPHAHRHPQNPYRFGDLHIHICVCVQVYIYAHIYIYRYTETNTHTHTHTHTHPQSTTPIPIWRKSCSHDPCTRHTVAAEDRAKVWPTQFFQVSSIVILHANLSASWLLRISTCSKSQTSPMSIWCNILSSQEVTVFV